MALKPSGRVRRSQTVRSEGEDQRATERSRGDEPPAKSAGGAIRPPATPHSTAGTSRRQISHSGARAAKYGPLSFPLAQLLQRWSTMRAENPPCQRHQGKREARASHLTHGPATGCRTIVAGTILPVRNRLDLANHPLCSEREDRPQR
jgi:hypothetical protein